MDKGRTMKQVVLIVCALLLLCACGMEVSYPEKTSELPQTETPEEPGGTESGSPAPSPTEYSFGDIEAILRRTDGREDLAVIEVRDAESYTVVHYTYLPVVEGQVQESRFAWFDRESGEAVMISMRMEEIARFHLSADTGLLTVLTSGWDIDTAKGHLQPQLIRVQYMAQYPNKTESYYRPVQEACRLGRVYGEDAPVMKLESIRFEEGVFWFALSLEAEIIANSPPWPYMEVENADGQSTITLRGVLPGEMSALMWDPRVLSVVHNGGDTTVTLRIGDAARYLVGAERFTEEGEEYEEPMPEAEAGQWLIPFRYVAEHVSADYPADW